MSNQNNLIEPHPYVSAYSRQGFGRVKNSKGTTFSLILQTVIQLDAETNELLFVEYSVELFQNDDPDYIRFVTKNYNEAIDKYNELAIKWSVHRDKENDNE